MILIVGLGNPGRGYRDTRHNIGFRVLDRIAERFDVAWRSGERGAVELAEVRTEREPVRLAKPQLFMNRSGDALRRLLRHRPATAASIWIVTDDLDLPFGQLRLRQQGSSGGHHGLDSIVGVLGTGFPRLRIGIAPAVKPKHFDGAAYVLERFSASERAHLPEIVDRAADALLTGIAGGWPAAMNQWNRQTPMSHPQRSTRLHKQTAARPRTAPSGV